MIIRFYQTINEDSMSINYYPTDEIENTYCIYVPLKWILGFLKTFL